MRPAHPSNTGLHHQTIPRIGGQCPRNFTLLIALVQSGWAQQRRYATLLAIAVAAFACSAQPTQSPVTPEPANSEEGAAQSSLTDMSAPGQVAGDSAGGAAVEGALPNEPQPGTDGAQAEARPTEPEPRAAEHCPRGMQLVEGEYCSKVEHRCVKDWYAKANAKTVCEAFEPWSKCVGSKSDKRFCIDKFSWPNKQGERPEVMNNFYQAQVKCAALGKRLCTESEWTMACEGPEMKPFPYGYIRDPKKCNGDKTWDNPDMTLVAKRDPKELARLWLGVRSGSQPECVSDYGVHDLPANNDEVVSSETYGSNYKGKYDSVHTGGPWYRGVRNQCRPKIYTHNEGFYYYFLGFRCCSEPDGAVNDPRTPKAIKRGEDFSKVERLARFTVEEMKQKLELKAKGQCSCSETDALCKTMCGTLLGPDAKDMPPGPEPAKP